MNELDRWIRETYARPIGSGWVTQGNTIHVQSMEGYDKDLLLTSLKSGPPPPEGAIILFDGEVIWANGQESKETKPMGTLGRTLLKAALIGSEEVWDRSEQKPLAQPTSAPVKSTQPDRDAPVVHNKGEEDMKDQLKKQAKHALKATMADQSFNTLLDIVQKKFEVSDDPKKQMVAAYLDDEYAREGIKFGVALAMMYGAETFPDHLPKSDMLYNLGCYQSQASMFNGMGAVLSALRQELVPILTEFQKELPEEVVKTFGEAEKATTFSFEKATEKAKETA